MGNVSDDRDGDGPRRMHVAVDTQGDRHRGAGTEDGDDVGTARDEPTALVLIVGSARVPPRRLVPILAASMEPHKEPHADARSVEDLTALPTSAGER